MGFDFIPDRSFVFRDLHILTILCLGLGDLSLSELFVHVRSPHCRNQKGLTLAILGGRLLFLVYFFLSQLIHWFQL